MMDAMRGWLSIIRWIGFWGVWVIYFLIHKGVDEGWADRHTVWWWILAVATFVFYITFQQYLD